MRNLFIVVEELANYLTFSTTTWRLLKLGTMLGKNKDSTWHVIPWHRQNVSQCFMSWCALLIKVVASFSGITLDATLSPYVRSSGQGCWWQAAKYISDLGNPNNRNAVPFDWAVRKHLLHSTCSIVKTNCLLRNSLAPVLKSNGTWTMLSRAHRRHLYSVDNCKSPHEIWSQSPIEQ